MEKGEPALVPEWLRSSGGSSGGGGSGHLFTSSPSLSDSSSTRGRIKTNSSVDPIRSTFLDRSSNTRRSSYNGFSKNAYSSFSRNNRCKDRDRDKERLNFSGDFWENESLEPLAGILPSREKDTLRRSHSMITGKHDDFLSGKGTFDEKNYNGNNHPSGNGLVPNRVLEKEFPSLGSEDRQVTDITRVASPVLTTAAQSLPMVNSVRTGELWTSALVDAPNSASRPSGSANGVPSPTATLHKSTSMAEALTQAPARARTSPQNPSIQTQRREELAIKQSRQLIPVTPTVPKLSVLSSDKNKPKTLVRSSEATAAAKSIQQQPSLIGPANLSSIKQEATKTSHGKLLVLKRGWENGVSPKESIIPSSSTQTAATSPAPVSLQSPNKQRVSGDRKQSAVNLISGLSLDKKPSLSQTKSRNDFFNHLKKKTSNPSSAAEQVSSVSSPSCDKAVISVQDIPASSSYDDILKFSEEETAFLRSLGWEENSGEEGLTEEEISSFYKEYMNKEPAKDCMGVQQKHLQSRAASVPGAASQF